jgi:FKBP-type peptidyl-prolyl cis-trans isomerase
MPCRRSPHLENTVKNLAIAALAAALLLSGCRRSEQDKTIYAIGVLAQEQLKVFALTPTEFDQVLAGLRSAVDGKAGADPEQAAMMEIQRLMVARQAAATNGAATPAPADPKTLTLIGVSFFQWFKQFGLKAAEYGLVYDGMKDAMAGKAEVKVADKRTDLEAFTKARQAELAAEAKKSGEAFLVDAAKLPGAQKTASGLIYLPLQEGTGAAPGLADKVKVNYTGKFVDGKVFDASAKHGGPASFPVGGVIPCWTEGLQKMKVGGKARLICPAAIAYGERGNFGIPGGATLDFEVELLEASAP